MSYLDDLFGLAGKTAIVSGGAGVIGTVMSQALLKAGANVVIWSGSPVQMQSRVFSVIIKGKVIPLTSFQTRLYDKFKKIVEERIAKKKRS